MKGACPPRNFRKKHIICVGKKLLLQFIDKLRKCREWIRQLTRKLLRVQAPVRQSSVTLSEKLIDPLFGTALSVCASFYLALPNVSTDSSFFAILR